MRRDLFAEVKSRISVTDVLGRYYGMRDAVPGRSILCPFHQETHPSFGVARDNMHGKCFSCGKGGDVVDLMLLQNGHANALEAAKRLAHDFGIPFDDDPEAVRRLEARQVNVEKLTKYTLACHGHLTDEDRDRLGHRGFDRELVSLLRSGRHLADKCPDLTWAKHHDAIVVPFSKGDQRRTCRAAARGPMVETQRA
ncbi:MAG TPA: CHC2 zinc finger domain-containing protein [Phycisphaerae bacterium]|nr:CHC2 zinc finger domain-containing protein [Phycisphaerae bacterium]